MAMAETLHNINIKHQLGLTDDFINRELLLIGLKRMLLFPDAGAAALFLMILKDLQKYSKVSQPGKFDNLANLLLQSADMQLR